MTNRRWRSRVEVRPEMTPIFVVDTHPQVAFRGSEITVAMRSPDNLQGFQTCPQLASDPYTSVGLSITGHNEQWQSLERVVFGSQTLGIIIFLDVDDFFLSHD